MKMFKKLIRKQNVESFEEALFRAILNIITAIVAVKLSLPLFAWCLDYEDNAINHLICGFGGDLAKLGLLKQCIGFPVFCIGLTLIALALLAAIDSYFCVFHGESLTAVLLNTFLPDKKN